MVKPFNDSGFEIFAFGPSSLRSKTERKLLSFKNLPDGWNYGCGRAIEDDVYKCATILLQYVNQLGISKTDVFPGTDGDVCLTAYRFSHYIEMVVEVDLTIAISHEVGEDEVLSKGGLTLAEAKTELMGVIKGIWGSSDLSTQPITIKSRTDLITWHSESLQTEVERLLSAENVLIIPMQVFANMFESSTQEYLGNLRFFGNLTSRFYQADRA